MAHPAPIVGNGNNVLLGRGAVYFDRFTAGGAKIGERFIGTCKAFEITMSEDTQEFYSSVDSASGLLSRVSLRRKAELRVAFNEMTRQNLALALFGTDKGVVANGSGSWTDEPTEPTTSTQGTWLRLPKRNATVTTLKDDTVGVPEDPDDWLLDSVTGRVFIPVGSVIVDGSVITVTGSYAAGNTDQVSGLDATVKGLWRFVGDPAYGPVLECEVFNTIVTPDGALSLIGDDYAEASVRAAILADTTVAGYPYFRMIKR